jgi:hypothetical protein
VIQRVGVLALLIFILAATIVPLYAGSRGRYRKPRLIYRRGKNHLSAFDGLGAKIIDPIKLSNYSWETRPLFLSHLYATFTASMRASALGKPL